MPVSFWEGILRGLLRAESVITFDVEALRARRPDWPAGKLSLQKRSGLPIDYYL